MLPDVGMVQMYSKSVNVNGLGFAWIGWPPLCMDQPPPCSYGFSARWFCHTLQVHTAPSLHLLLFLEKTFYNKILYYQGHSTKIKTGQGRWHDSN